MSVHSILRACLLGALTTVPVTASPGDDGVILSVRENAEAGSVVGDLAADGTDEGLRYSITTGNPDAAFAVDFRSGRLVVENSAALNYELRDRFDLTIQVARPTAVDSARRAFLSDVIDSGASTEAVEELLREIGELQVTVLVEDVAEGPVLPQQSVTLVADRSEAIEEAWISARDEDLDDALQFEILGGAPVGLFGIDPVSGRLRVDRPELLTPGDHEFPLTVRVTDSSNYSDATTIAVRVIALGREPSPLVVTVPPVASLPDESTSSPSASDFGPGDAGEVELISTGPPAVAANDDAASQSNSAPPVADSADAAPTTPSMGRRILRVAGMLLLFAALVAVVLWWLRRRTRRDDPDAFEDVRLRRLQLMREECDAEGTSDNMNVEESIAHQLSDLQEVLREHSQFAPAAVERVNQFAESQATDTLSTVVPAGSPLQSVNEQYDLYEVSQDESCEIAMDVEDEVTDTHGSTDTRPANESLLLSGLFRGSKEKPPVSDGSIGPTNEPESQILAYDQSSTPPSEDSTEPVQSDGCETREQRVRDGVSQDTSCETTADEGGQAGARGAEEPGAPKDPLALSRLFGLSGDWVPDGGELFETIDNEPESLAVADDKPPTTPPREDTTESLQQRSDALETRDRDFNDDVSEDPSCEIADVDDDESGARESTDRPAAQDPLALSRMFGLSGDKVPEGGQLLKSIDDEPESQAVAFEQPTATPPRTDSAELVQQQSDAGETREPGITDDVLQDRSCEITDVDDDESGAPESVDAPAALDPLALSRLFGLSGDKVPDGGQLLKSIDDEPESQAIACEQPSTTPPSHDSAELVQQQSDVAETREPDITDDVSEDPSCEIADVDDDESGACESKDAPAAQDPLALSRLFGLSGDKVPDGGQLFESIDDEPESQAADSTEIDPLGAATPGQSREVMPLGGVLTESADSSVSPIDEPKTHPRDVIKSPEQLSQPRPDAPGGESLADGQSSTATDAASDKSVSTGGDPTPAGTPPSDSVNDKLPHEFPATAPLMNRETASLPEVSGGGNAAAKSVDPRVRHLRDEIADKFGLSAADSSQDANSRPDDSSAAAGDTAPVGTPASVEDLAATNPQHTESWGDGLSTARFLLEKSANPAAVEAEPVTEPDAAFAPEAVSPPVPMKRRNKSEIRRELSSLREVAIRHARGRMAQEAPRQRTRRVWHVSACAMVILNFAALGLMASGPTGVLKVLAWALMLAGGCALAVCLHSFQQMDGDDVSTQSAVGIDPVSGQGDHA